MLITGYEGERDGVEALRAATSARLAALGADPLGEGPGTAWVHGRFAGPYLRDSLLDVGVLVETLETATFWSQLLPLYERVRTAVVTALAEQGAPSLVLCHISHVYPTGASLYFTVVAKELADPLAQWAAAKTAASEAIVAAGATITHHHGVGQRPPAVARAGDRPGRRRGAARGETADRPGRRPQPRES